MGLFIKATRSILEKPTKKLDKGLGRVKCPSMFCRSADCENIGGRKWHCRKCGRTFKA